MCFHNNEGIKRRIHLDFVMISDLSDADTSVYGVPSVVVGCALCSLEPLSRIFALLGVLEMIGKFGKLHTACLSVDSLSHLFVNDESDDVI